MAEGIYGPVNGARKKVEQVYGPLNGARKEVLRVYGGVNNTAERTFEKETEYGLVEYKDTVLTYYDDAASPLIATYEQSGAEYIFNFLQSNTLNPNVAATGEEYYRITVKVPSGSQLSAGEIPYGTDIEFMGKNSISGNTAYLNSQYTEAFSHSIKIELSDTITASKSFNLSRNNLIVHNSPTRLHELSSSELSSYSSSAGFSLDNGGNIYPGGIIGFSFGKSITSIGNSFLQNASNLVSISQIPNSVTSIGYNFLYGCTVFNQALTLPNNITAIGSNFLFGCSAFNQELAIPNSVTHIGASFLENCSSFNKQITLPNSLTSLAVRFMHYCRSYSKSITIPSSVTFVTGGSSTTAYKTFMRGVDNFVGPLELNVDIPTLITNSSSGKENSLTGSTGSAAVTQGILLTGPYAQSWKNALPDSSIRKLVLSR